MEKKEFTVKSWTEMFSEIGLDEATMHKWHSIFERRWPDEHQGFLEWLRVSEVDIERIRSAARSQWRS